MENYYCNNTHDKFRALVHWKTGLRRGLKMLAGLHVKVGLPSEPLYFLAKGGSGVCVYVCACVCACVRVYVFVVVRV